MAGSGGGQSGSLVHYVPPTPAAAIRIVTIPTSEMDITLGEATGQQPDIGTMEVEIVGPLWSKCCLVAAVDGQNQLSLPLRQSAELLTDGIEPWIELANTSSQVAVLECMERAEPIGS